MALSWGENAMRDGFSHRVAVALGFLLAFAVSLFVLAAMGGVIPP